MGRCSITRNLWLMFGVIGIYLVVTMAAAFYVTDDIQSKTHHLEQVEDAFLIKSLEFRNDVIQVQQWLTDISATRGLDGLDDGFDEAEKHAKRARAHIRVLRSLDSDNDAFYNKLGKDFENYYATGKKMARLYIDQGPVGGNPFMGTFDKTAAAISGRMETLSKRARERRQAVVTELNTMVTLSASATSIGSVVILVVVIFGIVYLTRLMAPLKKLGVISKQIANNDFSDADIAVKGSNDIAVLTQTFQFMQRNLRHSITEISADADELSASASTVAGAAEITRDSVNLQQREVEQIASAITEMAMTVQEVSNSTAATADAASDAENAAGTGQRIVDEAMRSINMLAQEVNGSTDSILDLASQSEKIGAVLDVIRGIAEQTNLLALNAAIEAARAGEQGRGFAVVADEVRTLAFRTQEATKEIQTMIEALQEGVRNAATIMGNSRQSAEKTVERASRAGQALREIYGAVMTIRDMSAQIATSSGQQSVAADEISRNVENIKALAEESAGAANQTSVASEQLGVLVQRLKGILAHFKT